ncbi:hypothetical protein AVEN_246144-1 [Araneus ventricosus]|uniref:Uncharacterized protein n=1 Tax=Araneus ventricosus TaxID=182803 RepID=A0A4Y2RC33_ARAVE|nr:hypothetical protein AVEN_246144-1 [Araneus ventricosus]
MGKSKHCTIVIHSRVLEMIHTYHGKYTNFKSLTKEIIPTAHANVLKKLPRNEHNFLKDQRATRLLYIGSLDINETKRLHNTADNADRNCHNLYLNHTQATSNAGYVDYEDEETDCSSDISEVDLNLDTYKPSASSRLISITDPKYKQLTLFVSNSSQMRFGLPSIAVVGGRFVVSDRAVAAIASSVLHDVDLITSNKSDLVVDKNRLRREKAQARKDLKFQVLSKAQGLPLKGQYFDGRKDSTLIEERVDTKRCTRKAKEEHLSLIEEPGSRYITHLSPSFNMKNRVHVTLLI